MYQVKIFTLSPLASCRLQDFQDSINTWLEANPNVEPVSFQHFQDTHNYSYNCIVLYKDLTKEVN